MLGRFSILGRALRYVAGVDESLMDKVPWERPWYASLGGVVIGTAVIAGFSMWFAISETIDASSPAAIVPASIWFVFIVIIDRWIISTRSTDTVQKLMLLATRGTLAVLFGIIIAEPLVLRVFQTQIEATIRSNRAANLSALKTGLETCNPDPGVPSGTPPPADCATRNHILSFSATPAAQLRQLSGLKDAATTLEKTIKADSDTLLTLDQKITDECAGVSGPGLSGRRGDGINCKENRRIAAQFAATHPVLEQQNQLADLRRQIAGLEGSMTASQGTFVEQRAAQIQQRLAAEPQVDSPIGLLERMSALHRLGDETAALGLGIILVRLLFITIDCSPVLMKVASGNTFYDRLVMSSLEDAVKTHNLGLEGKNSEREIIREEQAQLKREHDIRMQQRLADAVDARAEAYERQAEERRN